MLRALVKIHVLDNGLSYHDGILLVPHKQVDRCHQEGGGSSFCTSRRWGDGALRGHQTLAHSMERRVVSLQKTFNSTRQGVRHPLQGMLSLTRGFPLSQPTDGVDEPLDLI